MSAGKPHPAGLRRWLLPALGLVGIFAAELMLFWSGTGRHYAWVYPRWFDQLQYLQEGYGSYDRMKAGGFVKGAAGALSTDSPQGSLHGFLAMLAFWIAGPSRNSALAVNLVAFLALQLATFLAVRRISGSFAFAWAALGFLAAMHSPWSGAAGSATDFRLDWMAACAFGVALAAAVAGKGFRSMPWAVLFGLAVGLALLVRHLTAVYFGGIYLLLAAWILCRPGRGGRLGRLAVSGVCALLVSGWAFARAWGKIFDYYWVGHFVGPESALRDSHMGVASDARWLSSELLFHQLGLAAVLLGLGAMVAFRAARREPVGVPGRSSSGSEAWPVVLAFLAAPAVVLMFHPEKTPQPLNIMIPAAVWIFVLAWMQVAARSPRGAVTIVCAAVAIAGESLFAGAQARVPFDRDEEAGYRDINALSDFLYFRAEEAGLSRPRLAVSWVFDGLGAAPFEILGRERHRNPMRFIPTLPTGLFAADPAEVMARLENSDFVCLVTRGPPGMPFDLEMESMRPGMTKWCEANMTRDGAIETPVFSASIYERRGLARPAAGGGVQLAAMVRAAQAGPPDAPAALPGPAGLTSPRTVAWTTKAEFHYVLRAAYAPVWFRARGLPAGLALNGATGEISGTFPKTGRYEVEITAGNGAGRATDKMTFEVDDQTWEFSIEPPAQVRAGAAAFVGYSAFDSLGGMDFIDVTDLTAGKILTRLVANDDERRNWEGTCGVSLAQVGEHRIKLRLVRFQPGSGNYVFLDRECVINVGR